MSYTAREKIIDFILAKGTHYYDLFEDDPYMQALYREECLNFLCEGFLDNTLTPEQEDQFHEELRTNPEFRKNFSQRYDLHEFMAEEADLLLRIREVMDRPVKQPGWYRERKMKKFMEYCHSELDEDEDEDEDVEVAEYAQKALEVEKLRKKRTHHETWIALASVLLLACVSFMYTFYRYGADTPPDLYARYYRPFVESGSFERNSSAVVQARKSYLSGNYDESFQRYKVLSERIDVKGEIDFYYALSMMELNKHQEAIVQLEHFADNNHDSEFLSSAYWYLALCYVKVDRPNEARPLLELLVMSGSANSSDARDLLAELPSAAN